MASRLILLNGRYVPSGQPVVTPRSLSHLISAANGLSAQTSTKTLPSGFDSWTAGAG